MKKYYIGIAIICLLTLGFAGYVMSVGISSKQDVQTLKTAQDIASKLNTYVQNNQKIPESLSEVGVEDVPSAIKYTKDSEKEYSFCVTYKAASGYNDYGLGQSLVGTALSGGATIYDDPNYFESQYTPESLYVDQYHKAGENCQKVKPYFKTTYQTPLYNYNNLPDDKSNTPSSSVNQSVADSTRETDINTLQMQLESFYSLNGYYPTRTNLNDNDWVTKNLVGMDQSVLSDPSNSSAVIVAKPQAKAYSYEVTPAGCNNSAKQCTGYTLTATKSNGKTFVKSSLN